jgi:hypothetical protein
VLVAEGMMETCGLNEGTVQSFNRLR